ncbi:magnesium transporter [Candidatus Dependentiae bacterium]|nr:MAG: magnesium transporter [Candidatus Dependentiae bacterium]
MEAKKILNQIREHLEEVIKHDSPLGKSLWKEFLSLHPADIAQFLADCSRDEFRVLFLALPPKLQLAIFEELSDPTKIYAFSLISEEDKIKALNLLPAEELTDLFDQLSDEDLKKYLKLLNKTAREKVISLMKFHPESAGGIMDIEILSLREDFSVEKSRNILQRLRLSRDIYQRIYVTDKENHLVGFIKLEDLVLEPPKSIISSFMRKNELVVDADEDREAVAKKMIHYGLTTAPVIDNRNHLLGVIPAKTVMDVIVEEASEDVQKISALAPLKYPYFETSFWRILFERSYILIVLLLAQSLSTTIQIAYESTLHYSLLLYFLTMLISTGGNTSSQTSAVVIQGMASGEIRLSNIFRFLRREFFMAFMLALILGIVAFGRVFYTTGDPIESLVIGASLGVIVLVSVVIGSCIPIVLKLLNIDPAFSAGPFLATLMDILGVLIYCYIAKLILFNGIFR